MDNTFCYIIVQVYYKIYSMEEVNKYNDEPIFYCKSCLSLKIRSIPSMDDSEYCDECSSTDVGQTTK